MKPVYSLQRALAQPVRMFMLDFHLSILEDLVCEMLRYTVLCYAVLRYTVLRYTVLRYAVLRYTMLRCAILC